MAARGRKRRRRSDRTRGGRRAATTRLLRGTGRHRSGRGRGRVSACHRDLFPSRRCWPWRSGWRDGPGGQSGLRTVVEKCFVRCPWRFLAIQKLARDVESFLDHVPQNYDCCARRWVGPTRGSTPFGEAFAGVLMAALVLPWLSGPVALIIGTIGDGVGRPRRSTSIGARFEMGACVRRAARTCRLGFVSLDREPVMMGHGRVGAGETGL